MKRNINQFNPIEKMEIVNLKTEKQPNPGLAVWK